MLRAIGIKPINLTMPSEPLKLIVSERSLHKASPLNVTDRDTEKIVSRDFRLLYVED